jgi:hypothetical protein
LFVRATREKVAWNELTPDRRFFFDNSAGFGHGDELGGERKKSVLL